MGFCTSCGELANTPRCPRCKGRVSTATASGLVNRDAWSATYLDKQDKKVNTPNLNKLVNRTTFDPTLPKIKNDSFLLDHKIRTSFDPTLESVKNDLIVNDKENKLSDEPEILSPPVSSNNIKKETCGKCFAEVGVGVTDKVTFGGKFYHKTCFTCLSCSRRLIRALMESDSTLHCRDCVDKATSSTTSSPSIITPDDSPSDIDSKLTPLEPNLPGRGAMRSFHRSRPSLGGKGFQPDHKVLNLTSTFSSLNINSPNKSNDVSQLISPSYSKTFSSLQASVDNKLTSTPPILNSGIQNNTLKSRPRTSSDATAPKSFADLLASRKGMDNRISSINRRPLSTRIPDLKSNKRMSLPVPPKINPNNIPVGHSNLNPNTKPIARPISPLPITTRPTSNSFSNCTQKPLPSTSRSIIEPNIQPKPTVIPQPKPTTISPPTEPVVLPSKPTIKSDDDNVGSNLPSTSNSKPNLPSSSNSKPNHNSKLSSLANNMICTKCDLRIGDTWFRLPDGRILHKNCFTCHSCNLIFEDGKYSVYNDKEYHSECLLQLPLSPMSDVTAEPEDQCDRCHLLISGPCFTLTNGRQYHPKCFICAGCHKQFDQGTYVSKEDKEYHRECIPKSPSKPCTKCQLPIDGVFVTNNKMDYHSECFRCHSCRIVIAPSTPFGEVGNLPYCEPCLIDQHTNLNQNQNGFALSAQRQQQRRAKGNSFSILP